MTSLNRLFGWKEKTYLLGYTDPKPIATPMAIKEESDSKRIEKIRLEYAAQEGIVANILNVYLQTIMSGAEESYIEAQDPKVKAFFEEFVDTIGTTEAGTRTWKQLVYHILKYEMIYGMLGIENIYNVEGTQILDLDIINPVTFGYAKNASGNIALDGYGKPLGYVQSSSRFGSNLGGDPIPKGVIIHNQKFFLPKRISLFKLNEVGDGFYPYGYIEPVFQYVRKLRGVHKSYMNLIYRYPLLIAKGGDTNHEPTPESLKRLGKLLSQADYAHNLATAYFNEIRVEYPDINRLTEVFEYFLGLIIAGTGIPSIYATGKPAQSENRATLKIETGMYLLRCYDLVDRMLETFRNQVFRKICILNDFSEVPYWRWGEIEVPGMKSVLEEKQDDEPKVTEAIADETTSTSEEYGN